MSGERSHTDVAGGVLLDEVLSLCFDSSASANPSVCRRNSWMGVHHEERKGFIVIVDRCVVRVQLHRKKLSAQAESSCESVY